MTKQLYVVLIIALDSLVPNVEVLHKLSKIREVSSHVWLSVPMYDCSKLVKTKSDKKNAIANQDSASQLTKFDMHALLDL